IINEILADNDAVADTPQAQVGIEAFGDSAVIISYRYWVPTTQIIEHKLAINGAIYAAIQAANIEIPFPQRVVTLKERPASAD
ncbi:mechanosensitive ion channel protein MscS, partial [Pseudoalteromonas citrea]